MTEISKSDWKLFREKIGEWQERYMERLNKEYVELLQEDGQASDKFWKLEERIWHDKKLPGVYLHLRKSEALWDIMRLLHDGVITEEDLKDFSDELRAAVCDYA